MRRFSLCVLTAALLLVLPASSFGFESDLLSKAKDLFHKGKEDQAILVLEQSIAVDSDPEPSAKLLKWILKQSIERSLRKKNPKKSFPKVTKLLKYFGSDPEAYRLAQAAGFPQKIIASMLAQKTWTAGPGLSVSVTTAEVASMVEIRINELEKKWEKEKRRISLEAQELSTRQILAERASLRDMLIAWTGFVSGCLGLLAFLIFLGMNHKINRYEKLNKGNMQKALSYFKYSPKNLEGVPGAFQDESTPQGFYRFIQHHCQKIFTALELGESGLGLETKSIVAKLNENICEKKKDYSSAKKWLNTTSIWQKPPKVQVLLNRLIMPFFKIMVTWVCMAGLMPKEFINERN